MDVNAYYDILTEETIKKADLGVNQVLLYIKEVPVITKNDEKLDYYDNRIIELYKSREYVSLRDIIEEKLKETRSIQYIYSFLKSNYKEVDYDTIKMVYFGVFGNTTWPWFFENSPYDSNKYEDLYKEFKKEIARYKLATEPAAKSIKVLKSYPSLNTSLINISGRKMTAKVDTTNNINQIFDSIVVKNGVDIVIMNREHFKILPIVEKSKITAILDQKMPSQNIYIRVSLAESTNMTISLDYSEKIVEINTNNTNITKDVIKRKVLEVIPTINNFSYEEEDEYYGNFQIYGLNYNIALLDYAVAMLFPCRDFLISVETGVSLVESKHDTLHLKPLIYSYLTDSVLEKEELVARFNLIQGKHPKHSSTYSTFEGNTIIRKITPPSQYYINITFSKIGNTKEVYLLREYLSKLFYHYQREQESKISDELLKYGIKIETSRKDGGKIRKKGINYIKEDFGLSGSYSRECPVSRRPIPISGEQYNDLKGTKKDSLGTTISKKTNRPVYYYCSTTKHSVFQIKENGAPCCINPGRVRKGKTQQVSSKYMHTETTTLKPGAIGKLPPKLDYYLTQLTPGVEYVRLGCGGRESDPFMLCLKDALKINKTDKDIKKEILEYLENINYAPQENISYTSDDIKRLLEGSCIDSKLFYSILESIYNVSIFIMEMKKEDINFQKDLSSFYYSRTIKNRESILMLRRNIKVGCDSYELVVSYKTNSIDKRVLPVKITQGLYELYNYQNNVKIVSYSNKYGLEVHGNIYNNHNYYNLMKKIKQDVKQYIDNYGFLRYFLVDDVYICVNPVQGDANEFDLLTGSETVELPSLTQVLEMFDYEPSSVTFEVNLVTGVWYYYGGLYEGFYCPVDPVSKVEAVEYISNDRLIQIKPSPYLFFVKETPTGIISTMKRVAKNIMTFVGWLYTVYGGKIENFSKLFKVEPTITEFTEEIYDLEPLFGKSLKVPVVTGGGPLKEKLEEYSIKIPSLVKRNSGVYYISCYSEKMKTGLIYYLQNLERNKEIANNYFKIEGYSSYLEQNGLIFHGLSNLYNWYELKETKEVVTDLSILLKEYRRIYPLIYAEGNSYYLIQPVRDEDFFRCVSVCYSWDTNRVNTGYDTTPMKKEIPQTIHFKLEENGRIEGLFQTVLKTEVEKGVRTLKVLLYAANKFAAILPLK